MMDKWTGAQWRPTLVSVERRTVAIHVILQGHYWRATDLVPKQGTVALYTSPPAWPWNLVDYACTII